MPITTVAVTCTASRPDGSLIAGGKFRFLLSNTDTENGLVVPREISATANSSGVAVANLWPNSLGAAGTTYRVLLSDPLGSTIDLGSGTVPNSACNLHGILGLGPAPTIDQATVAKLAAQQSAAEASASAAASQASRVLADADVVLTHADVVLTHADVVQTGLDRVQTGLDRTASSASATSAAASQSSAATQASNSTTSAAASASSATTSAGSATTSTSQAAISTAQAVISTTQASNSSSSAAASASSASSASTSATTATTQASLSTTQANASSASAAASAASASAANTSAGASSGSAAQALAIYGSATAQQAAVVAAQAAQSVAQGYAASAASVVTQDLSGVTAQALHRSPYAINAMFVYDTSKDSDGGAWTEKCQNTSWYNEPLSGNWLGSASNELVARCTNATLGTDVTNGGFDTDTVWTKGTGWVISNGVASIASGTSPSITQNAPQTLALGDIVKVTFTLLSLATGRAYIVVGGTDTNSGSEQFYIPGTYTRYVTVSTLTNQTVGIVVGNSPTGISIDNVSFRKITSLNTASNDYFQLTTDGKFYRLWKNILKGSGAADLNTTTYWTKVSIASVSAAGYVVPSAGTQATQLIQSFTNFYTGAKATVLVKAKADTLTKLWIGYGTTGNNNAASTVVDVSGGTVVASTTVGGGSITLVGSSVDLDGYRQFQFNIGVSGSEVINSLRVSPTTLISSSPQQPNIQTNTTTFDGTSGLYIKDVQLEWGVITNPTYEAKTVDGSTTEVFRGNKAKFPKLVGIVADGTGPYLGLTFYDLTEPNRPMWMRFKSQNSAGELAILDPIWGSSGVSCISALNGIVVVGSPVNQYYSGTRELDFARDRAISRQFSAYGVQSYAGLAKRNYPNTVSNSGGYVNTTGVVDGRVYAVAMTVLPDAPLDPVTGLQVPTIAVATAGGVSVIKHDGTVVNLTNGSGIATIVKFLENNKLFYASDVSGNSYTSFFHVNAIPTVSTDYGAYYFGTSDLEFYAGRVWGGGTAALHLGPAEMYMNRLANALTKSMLWLSDSALPAVYGLKRKPSGKTGGTTSTITNIYNTGHLLGDIRRAYLADSVVGSFGPTAELVVNGTFDTDLTGWTVVAGTATVSGGVVTLTNPGGAVAASITQVVTVTVGKAYRVTGQGGLGNNGKAAVIIGTSLNGNDILNAPWNYGLISNIFVATTSTIYIKGYCADATTGMYGTVDNISVKELVADRSYKAANANIYGTLTKALTNTANQVVAYSGFSSANYLQEPYSADLDFGTGEFSVSAWFSPGIRTPGINWIPNSGAVSGSSVGGGRLITRGAFTDSGTGIVADSCTATAGVSGCGPDYVTPMVAGFTYTFSAWLGLPASSTLTTLTMGAYGYGASYVVITPPKGSLARFSISVTIPTPTDAAGFANWITALNSYGCQFVVWGVSNTTNQDTFYFAQEQVEVGSSATTYKATTSVLNKMIAERNYSSGASIALYQNAANNIVAVAYDGTTTRTVTTSVAYNTDVMSKVRAIYKTDGSLAITVNGVQVAITYGNPLLTLNNSNAVLTIGNSYALNAPFPGSITMLKLSATAPTSEQALFMYEQEKQMFRDGAQCLLPDSGTVVDLAYDDVTDKWIAASATNESSWVGLVRTGVTAVPAGSNIKVQAASGVKLNARSTTSPGVDVTLPAYNLKEEIVKRGEAAAKLSRIKTIFDYVGGFTATTVVGNTAITAVAGLVYPSTVNLRGCVVTGTGIPASTTIVDIVGTTIYLSAKATAAGTLVQISLTDFPLPVGYEAKNVIAAGAVKVEGSTKDFTRLFDGFKETIRFGTAPGYTAAVQLQAIRSAT